MEIFLDSLGNQINVGDTIKITKHYTFPHMENIPAKIIWDKKNGRYQFTYKEIRNKKQFTTTDDFCGVHSFQKILL